MAATTLTDFYVPFVNPGADEATRMRVSRLATIAWGLVQLGVALAAQFMARSVLDAGLSVLSLGSGPVLGAFLLGTLSRSVREQDVFVGMVAGLLVMAGVWWASPIAFTWFVLIGATTTAVVAALSLAMTATRRTAEAG
jgi:Na+/proline symporter